MMRGTANVVLLVVFLGVHLRHVHMAGFGLSHNDLKQQQGQHRGRHGHGHGHREHGGAAGEREEDMVSTTTPAATLPPAPPTQALACCSRQEKLVAIGFGVSGEVVQLDVGQCSSKCRQDLEDLLMDDTDDFPPAQKHCPRRGATCVPVRSTMERVSTLHGVQEVSVVEACECRGPSPCKRHPHEVLLFPGTPFETHLDVGVCAGSSCDGSSCQPIRNKTASIPGPNGVQCHSVIEECACVGSCYRMRSLETVYDYTGTSDNNTKPAVKEIDVGRCVGSCSGGQTRKCLFRDQMDPSKCLAGLYGKQSSCTPSQFQVHRYTSRDQHFQEIISITDCKCM